MTQALQTAMPAEPIEPWISLAAALVPPTAAALLAMLLAWIVIVLLIEVYDAAIGAHRPPAGWRRPWCWAFGHDDHGRPGGVLSSTCPRCGGARPEATPR